MTLSIVNGLQDSSKISPGSKNSQWQYCNLYWRRGQLLVTSPRKFSQPYLPALDNEKLLVECLKSSPVSLVTIDPVLGNATVQFWANACQKAKKPIYIIPSTRNQLQQSTHQLFRVIQKSIDSILALILLLVLSPLMLGLIIMMRSQSPELVFSYEWYVEETGKLFQVIKFSTTGTNKLTFLGFLISTFGLDNLPKLLNVLRGEMTLLGSSGCTLADAVHFRLENSSKHSVTPV